MAVGRRCSVDSVYSASAAAAAAARHIAVGFVARAGHIQSSQRSRQANILATMSKLCGQHSAHVRPVVMCMCLKTQATPPPWLQNLEDPLISTKPAYISCAHTFNSSAAGPSDSWAAGAASAALCEAAFSAASVLGAAGDCCDAAGPASEASL